LNLSALPPKRAVNSWTARRLAYAAFAAMLAVLIY
jgi:hypothetical protein